MLYSSLVTKQLPCDYVVCIDDHAMDLLLVLCLLQVLHVIRVTIT